MKNSTLAALSAVTLVAGVVGGVKEIYNSTQIKSNLEEAGYMYKPVQVGSGVLEDILVPNPDMEQTMPRTKAREEFRSYNNSVNFIIGGGAVALLGGAGLIYVGQRKDEEDRAYRLRQNTLRL